MPRKAANTDIVQRPGRTDLAALDQQLAAEAANDISKAIAKPSGRKITVKNKQFLLPDGTILGDTIDVIIVAFISANRYYPDQFNPNDMKPPVCFAFGKDISTMAPPEEAPEKQSDSCARCPMNQWESDPKGGKGKACKNTRELAVILGGDAGDPDAQMYTLGVSPTGIKSFDAVVGLIVRTFNGPPVKAMVSITCNPVTEYVSLVFMDPVPNDEYAAHYARRPEAQELLFVLPDLTNYVPPGAKPAGRAAPPTTNRGRTNARR